jgi:flagellar biosynthetic protein FliR
VIEAVANLVPSVHAFLYVAARLFCLMVAAPGWGELIVPKHVRLFLSLALGVLLTPLLPDLPVQLTLPLLAESCALGFALGMVVRLLFEALGMAGSLMGQHQSLGGTMDTDPSGQSKDLFSSFLRLYFLALLFGGSGHLLFVQAFAKTFALWPLGAGGVDALCQVGVKTLVKGTQMALSMAIPCLVASVFFIALMSILSRLVPMMPTFFVLRPLDSVIAAFVLWACFPYITHVVQDVFIAFFLEFG